MIAVTAEDFEKVALTWLATISVLVGAILTGLIALLPRIAALRQTMKDYSARLDDHSKRITENSSRVTQVALEIEPRKRKDE